MNKKTVKNLVGIRTNVNLLKLISCLVVFLMFIGRFASITYAVQPTPSIVYESVDIRYYEDGSPYIHDILTNHTDKRITETEYCMLAYNEKGSPLKLHWDFLDSSAECSYENLVRTKTSILPDQTEDYYGGWSLYDGERMKNLPEIENGEVTQVAYSLFCLRQVVFEDGTVWNNPDYENWYKDFAGKEIDVEELKNYYPHKYELKMD